MHSSTLAITFALACIAGVHAKSKKTNFVMLFVDDLGTFSIIRVAV